MKNLCIRIAQVKGMYDVDLDEVLEDVLAFEGVVHDDCDCLISNSQDPESDTLRIIDVDEDVVYNKIINKLDDLFGVNNYKIVEKTIVYL